MRGVLYSTDSKLTAGKKVLEIWIEEAGISINEEGFAYKTESPSKAYNHFGSFSLSDSFIEAAKQHIAHMAIFKDANTKVFTTLRRGLEGQKDKHMKIT
jgi:hypothetical protein